MKNEPSSVHRRGRRRADNLLRLQFPSLSVNEGFARSAVSSFLSQLDPTISELSDLKCAVSEAVTNCIVHAYKDTIGVISLDVRIFSDRTVSITVKDRGCGIADVHAAMQPLYTTDHSGERSGMGFAVMEHFTDRLSVSSSPAHGTRVTMVKKLSSPAFSDVDTQ